MPRADRLRAAAAGALQAGRRVVTRASRAAWRVRAELLTATAAVGGWALVTAGVAQLTAPVAWRFSGGLLLLTLCGWKFLAVIARDGLYKLTRAPETRRG